MSRWRRDPTLHFASLPRTRSEQYGENVGLVMAVASAVASHSSVASGAAAGSRTARTLHPGLLARAVAREAPSVLEADEEDGLVLVSARCKRQHGLR